MQAAADSRPKAVDGGVRILEPSGGGGEGIADEIHAPQQRGGLLRPVLPGFAVQSELCDLYHQRGADQQRNQGAQQHGGKKPVAEGIFEKAHVNPPKPRPIGAEWFPGALPPSGGHSPPGSAFPWRAESWPRPHHCGRSGGRTGCPAAAAPPGSG